MFSKKNPTDISKRNSLLLAKFLDCKKETQSKFRSIRGLLETYEPAETKDFFRLYYSDIYQVVFEQFGVIEQSIRKGGYRSHKDDLDNLINLLEKVIIYLPDLIQRKWQFNSICTILRKLLHHANPNKVRMDGAAIFIMWLQCLQENTTAVITVIFGGLVPGLGLLAADSSDPYCRQYESVLSTLRPVLDESSSSSSLPRTMHQGSHPGTSSVDAVVAEEITPIAPVTAHERDDHPPEDPTKTWLEHLLRLLTSKLLVVEWDDPNRRCSAFYHSYNLLKRFYIKQLFPDISDSNYLYQANTDEFLTDPSPAVLMYQTPLLHRYRDFLLRWLYCLLLSQEISSSAAIIEGTSYSASMSSDSMGVPSQAEQPNMALAPQLLMSSDNLQTQRLAQQQSEVSRVVQRVMFCCRSNVQMLMDLFKQTFLLPFYAVNIKHVICIFTEWMKVGQRPPFMCELDKSTIVIPDCQNIEGNDTLQRSSGSRTKSYLMAVTGESAGTKFLPQENVHAGFLSTLRLFLANSFMTFLSPVPERHVGELKESWKRVIHFYRNFIAVYAESLDFLTWKQYLSGMVICTKRMVAADQYEQLRQFGSYFMQTLFISWIKANHNVFIPPEMWDHFTDVISSVIHSHDVLTEWAENVSTLMKHLCQTLYNINIEELPLDRLTEKQKRRLKVQIKKGKGSSSSSTNVVSFSKNWIRLPVQPQQDIQTEDVIESVGFEQSETNHAALWSISEEGTMTVSVSEISEAGRNGIGVLTDAGPGGKEVPVVLSPPVEEPGIRQARFKDGEDPEVFQEDVSAIGLAGSSSSLDSLVGGNLAQRNNSRHRSSSEGSVSVSDRNYPESDSCSLGFDSQADGICGAHKRKVSASAVTKKDTTDVKTVTSAYSDSEFRIEEPGQTTSRPANLSSSAVTAEAGSRDDNSQRITLSGTLRTRYDDTTEVGPVLSATTAILPVVLGGPALGCSAYSLVVLWRRMMGVLGNINLIEDIMVRVQVYQHITHLWDLLEKVRRNMAVSLDNKTSPRVPYLIPPLGYWTPWCFEALMHPSISRSGSLLALELLLMSTLRKHDIPLTDEYLLLFYYTTSEILYKAAMEEKGNFEEYMNSIVAYAGSLYYEVIPASNLMLDLVINAVEIITASPSVDYPHIGAATDMGSILFWTSTYADSLFYPISPDLKINAVKLGSIREKILSTCLKVASKVVSIQGRCIAVCCLGLAVAQCLVQRKDHHFVRPAVALLIQHLTLANKTVACVTVNVLWSLCPFINHLDEVSPSLSARIIEAMSIAVVHVIQPASPDQEKTGHENDLLVHLLLCLAEWCVMVGKGKLGATSKSSPDSSVMSVVFEALLLCLQKDQRPSKIPYPFLPNSIINDENSLIRLCPVVEDEVAYRSDEFDDQLDAGGSVPVDISAMKMKCPISAAASFVVSHLVNFIGHYPTHTGAGRICSLVSEQDDCFGEEFNPAGETLTLMYGKDVIMSFIELPTLPPDVSQPEGLVISSHCSRMIVRDAYGKYCWEVVHLQGIDEVCTEDCSKDCSLHPQKVPVVSRSTSSSTISEQAGGRGDASNCALYQLLEYIGDTSPECLSYPDQPLYHPSSSVCTMTQEQEAGIAACVSSQQSSEEDYVAEGLQSGQFMTWPAKKPVQLPCQDAFHVSRLVLSQLGYLATETRRTMDTLRNSEQLRRLLNHIDERPIRETHKIAVFYIAAGQEDKVSILNNTQGSPEFEEFVAGLGWEVNLVDHTGFLGGLQRNQSTGTSAPYYATPGLEVVFHVSTRMPAGDEGNVTKLRHLGNDEIHIIWSEHNRDFRRGIINTQFGDVMITIYPLPNHHFRIQILKRKQIPLFGPLFNGAIVSREVLPALVRATAVNAGRAKRSLYGLLGSFYEERVNSIHEIYERHREQGSFEQYSSRLINLRQFGSGLSDGGQSTQDGTLYPSYGPFSFGTHGSSIRGGLNIDSGSTVDSRRTLGDQQGNSSSAGDMTSIPNQAVEDNVSDSEVQRSGGRRRSITKRIIRSAVRSVSSQDPSTSRSEFAS